MKGAGTVHHVAWTIADGGYEWWIERLRDAGVELVEVADRYYFRSVYFRLPGGVLFELATRGPGFGVDEPLETLGSRLSLPPAFASRRAELEASLAPLRDPRERWSVSP
jgi:glyoxalase family protein